MSVSSSLPLFSPLLREHVSFLNRPVRHRCTCRRGGDPLEGADLYSWGDRLRQRTSGADIHAASGRKGKFVAVDCTALPETLIESESFGYRDGAFTGSRRGGAPGLIRDADQGTLFLDEIGDMPVTLQARLLRFLDQGTVRALGCSSEEKVDVQILAATNCAIEEAVESRC